MSKALPADVTAMGFNPKTFGQDSETWDAYLQVILDTATVHVADHVGATIYAAAGDIQALQVKRLECLWAAAELMDRAQVIFLRNITADNADNPPASGWTAASARYQAEYNAVLGALGLSPVEWIAQEPSIAPATSLSTTSHFAEDQP